MAELKKLVDYLDSLYQPKAFDDLLMNGLLIEGRNSVKKIAVVVDASMEAFELARKRGCQLVIAHHGFITKDKPIRGIWKKRLKYLIDNNMSLYVIHFPLDYHQEMNHNGELARMFKAKPISPLFKDGNREFGVVAEFDEHKKREDFMVEVEQKLDTPCHLLAFGKKSVKRVGISCGSAPRDLTDIEHHDLDLLFTGEPKHSNHHDALEMKLNVLYAGHYATEKPGMWLLQKHIEKRFKDIKTFFLDIPTSV
ncbi:Nif3-like dinuclear metal center hexameric protein [Candidatus Woesearchaeota archaeon]|nr:Nif3-like dinuclear metal center hexameric protein [Candidatus Woesearchaeota archaeon]